MRTLGVDISHWEGEIDWEAAYPWMPFVYFKATEGTSWVDPQFYNNKAGCDKFGIPSAPYHYWHPEYDPVAQANHFIATAGKYPRYIVDVEDRKDNIPADIVGRLYKLLTVCEELTGIKPAIYTSAGYWNQYMNPIPKWADDYDLIVAHYTTKRNPIIPNGWLTWKIWQFGDNFMMQGCKEYCDGDWFNGTLDECREWFGNYRPVTAPPPQPVGELQFAVEYADGLRIRNAPSLNADIVGLLNDGEVIEAWDVAGADAWVKHNRGWSAKKIGNTNYLELV
jgi:lysozyme